MSNPRTLADGGSEALRLWHGVWHQPLHHASTPHLAPANLLSSLKESGFLPAGSPHFRGFLYAVSLSLSAARSVFSGPETLGVEKPVSPSSSHKTAPAQQPRTSLSPGPLRPKHCPVLNLLDIIPLDGGVPTQGRHSCDPKKSLEASPYVPYPARIRTLRPQLRVQLRQLWCKSQMVRVSRLCNETGLNCFSVWLVRTFSTSLPHEM